jgi:tetratricopeptide (TPR) repeat protein
VSDDLPPLDTADEEELQSAAALARALDGGAAEPGLPEEALQAASLLRSSAGGGQLSAERKDQIRRSLLAGLPPARAREVRSSPRRWWLLGLPLAGAAAALSLLLVGTPEPELEARRSEPSAFATSPSPMSPPPISSVVSSAAGSGTVESFAATQAARPTESARALGRAARAKGEASAQLAVVDRGQSLARRTRNDGARQVIVGLDKDARALRSSLLQRLADPALTRAHAERDAASGRGALEQSRDTLVSTLATLEQGLSEADARLVRQDLYCRLAETALALGEAQTALEWTRRGLALDGPPTPFLAQLSALEGDALAQLGDDESAAKSYLKALKVHENLLGESLDGR